MNQWQLFFLILAGWVNHDQQEVLEYLQTENRVLKEKLGKKRILLNDNQRRRLAVKGKVLGHARLSKTATLFTPDTILRWHRKLIATKFDSSANHSTAGRPRIRQVVVDAILNTARENPTWGYRRIQGALANVGYELAESTIANVQKEHGIEPAPDRMESTSWKTFLKAHWDVLAAIDFTTVEVWTARGLVTIYLLFVMDIKTRRVHPAGCTTGPNGEWTNQVARNLTDCKDGFLNDKRYLLMDRDTKFTNQFRETLKSADVASLLTPPFAPNANAWIERFFRSLKHECLNRMIFFGERSLRSAVEEYLEHYHTERNHQGLNNRLIDASDEDAEINRGETIPIVRRERLGGMLNHYHRAA